MAPDTYDEKSREIASAGWLSGDDDFVLRNGIAYYVKTPRAGGINLLFYGRPFARL